MSNNIHNGHRRRLRKRFMETEFNGFQVHEMLELLLFYTIHMKNTNELAHRLINKFGSVYEVFEADEKELLEVPGVGNKTVELIKICRYICKYYIESDTLFIKYSDFDKFVFNFFDNNSSSDIFLVLNVDDYNNIKGKYVFPKEAFTKDNANNKRTFSKSILKNKMYRIIVVHNHINKSIIPDDDDYFAIKFINELSKLLEVTLFDYMIFNGKTLFSMHKSGAFLF